MKVTDKDWGEFDRLTPDTAYYHFDGLRAFAAAAKAGNKLGHERGTLWSHADEGTSSNYGGSFAAAVRMANGAGWDGALEAMESERVSGADSFHTDSLNVVYDVSGADVDMGRYMTGVPECMMETPLSAPSAPVVSILVSFGASWSVGDAELLKRATVVASVLEWARASGIVVEVYSASGTKLRTQRKRNRIVSTVFVGDSRGDYNPALTAFAIGHPALLRRLEFGLMDGENEATQSAMGHGRGSPTRINEADLPPVAIGGPVVVVDTIRGRNTLTVDELKKRVMRAAEKGEFADR